MVNYQILYTRLFNACTDAVRQIEKQNYGAAKEILVQAQQETEELYIGEERQNPPFGYHNP